MYKSQFVDAVFEAITPTQIVEKIEELHPQPPEAETFNESDVRKLVDWLGEMIADEEEIIDEDDEDEGD